MTTPNWIPAVSAIASVVSAIAAAISAKQAEGTAKENKNANRKLLAESQEANNATRNIADRDLKMFKRQFVFELHNAWSNIREVDPSDPDTDDAFRGAGTLRLTATAWLHDVMDQDILHQIYRDDYVQLYDLLNKITDSLPKSKKSGVDLLTEEVITVYHEMKEKDRQATKRSKITETTET